MSRTGKYTKRIHLQITPDMFEFLKVLAERGNTSLNDVIREALRQYLDEQDSIIGGRSRFANRVARQMELERANLDAWGTFIVAAILVGATERGGRGSAYLEQYAKIARQAKAQIRAMIAEGKK